LKMYRQAIMPYALATMKTCIKFETMSVAQGINLTNTKERQ